MPPTGRTDTRRQVLDAALEIVASQGLQALTHRGVEARAQVSHGVTTYYFKNRDALIEALFEHICDMQVSSLADLQAKMSAQYDGVPERPDRYRLTEQALTALLEERQLALARYEVYLQAARHPRLRDVARRCRERHAAVWTTWFRLAGAPHPERAALQILSAVEGLLLYQMSVPEDDFQEWSTPYVVVIAEALRNFDASQVRAAVVQSAGVE